LIGVVRRTVIRGTQKAERLRFLNKVRHGGKFHRNSYQPNWARFREAEEQWKARKRTKHWKSDATEMSPCVVPERGPLVGDNAGTQTILNNHSHLTSAGARQSEIAGAHEGREAPGHPRKRYVAVNSPPRPVRGSGMRAFDASKAAARVGAERRWNKALTDRFSASPDKYATVIAALDQDLQNAATEAELTRPGNGLALIVVQLAARGLSI
jgi:hypothetical protein